MKCVFVKWIRLYWIIIYKYICQNIYSVLEHSILIFSTCLLLAIRQPISTRLYNGIYRTSNYHVVINWHLNVCAFNISIILLFYQSFKSMVSYEKFRCLGSLSSTLLLIIAELAWPQLLCFILFIHFLMNNIIMFFQYGEEANSLTCCYLLKWNNLKQIWIWITLLAVIIFIPHMLSNTAIL